MSIPQLIQNMCADLSDTDFNFIRKSRGFSASETISRSAFASFYVTSVGVAEAMQKLSAEEAITLRLLHETGEVDIEFFERLYPVGERYGTYTQKYKSVFEDVKKNLVRRGLVVMAEVKTRAESVQLERWRFALPPEFAPYLPPLPSVQNDQPGQTSDHLLRKKLFELVDGSSAIADDLLPLHIQHGGLYLQKYPFSLATFGIWQTYAWQHALKIYKSSVPASLEPTQAVLQLLSREAWITPKALEPALKIYCFGAKIPPADKLLHHGWSLGLLARLEINAVYHYRLAPAPAATGINNPYPDPLFWANTTSKPGSVKIDLRLIPLGDLDRINTLGHLTVEDGALLASPSPVKLGRATPAQRNTPLSIWLAEHVQAFGKALQNVNAQWGKTILHENLLVARVRDLSLRVQLERELKDRLILLNDHFIAFPIEARAHVEKVLKKTGFVVKTVKNG